MGKNTGTDYDIFQGIRRPVQWRQGTNAMVRSKICHEGFITVLIGEHGEFMHISDGNDSNTMPLLLMILLWSLPSLISKLWQLVRHSIVAYLPWQYTQSVL